MLNKQRKETKTNLIYEQLHQDILNNIFMPGEHLPLSALKDRYQVGSSPLRESLSRLATQGLLEAEAQCGFRVATLSIAELEDIYMVREAIDIFALERAITLGDDAWEAEVVASAHRLAKYIDPNTQSKEIEVSEWEKRQRDFIFAIVKGSQSPWLLKIHTMLYDQAARYRRLCLQTHCTDKEVLNSVILENQQLVDAIISKDINAARSIFQIAWQNTVKTITTILKNQQ